MANSVYEQSQKNFLWFMYWFWSQSDKEWEHSSSCTLNINRFDSELIIDLGEHNIVPLSVSEKGKICSLNKCNYMFDGNQFKAKTSPPKTKDLFELFRNFAKPYYKFDHVIEKFEINDCSFDRLIDWIQTDFTHSNKDNFLTLSTLDNPGWHLKIALHGSKFQNLKHPPTNSMRTENDWLVYRFEKQEFWGACGPLNLLDLIESFNSLVHLESKKINQSRESLSHE